MPSTYSPDLRIELIANGEQSGTWGTTTNNNLGTLIEQAIAGVTYVTTAAASYTLTASDGIPDEARSAVLVLNTSTSADYTVVIPAVQKSYAIRNDSSLYSVTISSGTGDTVKIPPSSGLSVFYSTTAPVGVRVVTDVAVGGFDVVGNLTVDGALDIGSATVGSRLAGTYTQIANTVTVTTGSPHGFTNGETVEFINISGLGVSGAYVIAYVNTVTFTFTSAVSQTTSGNCLLTVDVVTLNGIITPGAIIEGSSTIPALRITQTGSGLALLVEDSDNPDTTPFAVNASGNVGVGTTTPTQLLDIVSETVAIDQISRYSTDVSAPARVIRKARGTVAAPTIVADDDTAGTTVFQAYDGAAFQPVAQIRAEVDGTPAAGDMPGRLILSTTPDGTAALVDRVTVDNAGNVIIGKGEATATPVGNIVRAPNVAGTDLAGSNLVIQAGNGTGTGVSGYIALQTANPTTTGTTAGTMVDRLKIQQNGLMLGQYSTMGAGVVPSESFFRLNADFVGTASVTTAQPLFGVGITLAANTVYAFEMVVALVKTTGSSSNILSLLYDIGTGTISDIDYQILGVSKGNATSIPLTTLNAPDALQYAQVATAIPVTSAISNSFTYYIGKITGTVTIGTSGKFTPQYQTSASVGAFSTKAGSFIRMYPIGPASSNVNVGGWA